MAIRLSVPAARLYRPSAPTPAAGPDSTEAQDRYFFDCIKEGRPIGAPAADLDEAIATMELAAAILAGLRKP